MKAGTTDAIQQYYPDLSGPPYVHVPQLHVLAKSFWPLLDPHIRPPDVIVHLGCGSGSVDVVTSRWSTRPISDRRQSGGLAPLVVPNAYHTGMILGRTAPTWLKHLVVAIRPDRKGTGHYRANTERQLDRLFRGAGFQKEDSCTVVLGLLAVPLPVYAIAARVGRRRVLKCFRMQMLGLYGKTRDQAP